MHRPLTIASLLLLPFSAALAQGVNPAPRDYWKSPTIGKRDQGYTARIQGRYSVTEGSQALPTWLLRDDNGANDDYNTRRIRLGTFDELRDDLLYFVQVRRDWGAEESQIHDLYLSLNTPGFRNLVLGHSAVPFGRQYLTSDPQLPLGERPLAETLLVPDRGIGLLAYNHRATDRLGWYAGVYPGKSKNDWSTGSAIMTAARVEYLLGPNLNIGLQWACHPDTATSTFQKFLSRNGAAYGLQPLYAAGQVDETAYGVDMLYRNGPASLWGGYTSKEADGGAVSVTAHAWYLEAGQYIPFQGRNDKLELVLGYQDFDPNTAVTDQLDAHWLAFGANYHVEGTRRQWRLNYTIRDEGADDVANNTVMLEYDHQF